MLPVNCSQINATESQWWYVNIASGDGLLPSGNKPLPESMLTQISFVIDGIRMPQWINVVGNAKVSPYTQDHWTCMLWLRDLDRFWRGLLSQCTRACANSTSNPSGYALGIWLPVSHAPSCIGTTNPDRSVLITIITWHFQFHPVDVNNLCVKGAYVLEARAVSRAPPIVTSRGAP